MPLDLLAEAAFSCSYCRRAAHASTAYAAPQVRPAHQYDLTHVKFDLSVDFIHQSIAGIVSNSVTTTTANATLSFDKGPMTISSVNVTTENGKPVACQPVITAEWIKVPLLKTAKGTKLVVTIRYSASPEAGLYFVPKSRSYPADTDLIFTQGEMEDTRYWLPTYDYPDDKATTEGIIRVPAGMSVLSNGALASKRVEKGRAVYHWKQDLPMSTYLISVVAGDFVTIPDGSFQGKPIEIWAPRGTEAMAKAAFAGTDSYVALFSRLTGIDYPWAKYAQSAVPEFMFGGMENTSATTQTIGALFPANSIGISSADNLNAHELAHQWFGDLITTPSWPHIWVNEGWATFMPHFAVREKEGEDAFHISRYETYAGAYFGGKSGPMIRKAYQNPIELFDANAYSGGAARMFMLMNMIGEESFWRTCKSYLTEFQYKNVTTEQFFGHWGKVLKRDLTDFMKQWFYTPGLPSIKVGAVSGGYEIRQLTKNWKVETTFLVMSETGELRRKGRFRVGDQQRAFIETQPGDVLIVDPGAWLLCEIDYPSYTAAQWKHAYALSENAAQKMRIVQKLSADAEIVEGLYAGAESVALKRSLAGFIQREPAILEMAKSEDSVLVNTAINKLQNFKSPESIAMVESVFQSTPNESLKSTAFNSLLRLKNDAATAEIGMKTKTFDLSTQIAALNWYASNQKDKARAMCLELIAKPAPGPLREAAIRNLGRLKDGPGSKKVLNTLITLAKERTFAPMTAAIDALAEYGDPAAVPVLRARANHSLHFARSTIESALKRLSAPPK